jgi:hypothetical protein
MGAALVGGGYAWLLIPLVLSSELDGHVKGVIVTELGATPLATKILAIVLLGVRCAQGEWQGMVGAICDANNSGPQFTVELAGSRGRMVWE